MRRQPHVGAGDGDEHGVAHERLQRAEPVADESGDAACLGLLDDAPQLERRVVLVDDEQAVDARATRVEEIPRESGCERDVRDERHAREAKLQLAHALEVGLAVREEVEDREVHGLVFAGGRNTSSQLLQGMTEWCPCTAWTTRWRQRSSGRSVATMPMGGWCR